MAGVTQDPGLWGGVFTIAVFAVLILWAAFGKW